MIDQNLAPLGYFTHAQRRLQRQLIETKQSLDFLQSKPIVKDGPLKFNLKGGSIDFNNVCFSYDGSKQVIKDVTFHASAGQKVVLVGETGGGKSTILKLLFRFYDVGAGSIKVDGQDVRSVTLASLRERIGVVPQNPTLLNDTFMSNIRYSRLEAPEEEVFAACKAATIHDKILSFSDGYNSKVGEDGVKLTGVEIRRIAIARAILKEPKIILLDEATSSVDTEAERKVQDALVNLTDGRTTFRVAHHLSSVMNADLMIVLKDGQVIEQGVPRELLKAKGKYFDLWSKKVGIMPSTTDKFSDGPLRSSSSNEGENPKLRSFDHARSSSSAGKSFRPDAPEFVPRKLQSSSSEKRSDDPHISDLGQNWDGSCDQFEKPNESNRRPGQKNKRQPSNPSTGPYAANTWVESSSDTQRTSNGQGNSSSTWETSHMAKRIRSGRRNLAKSEPTGSVLGGSQGNGASEKRPLPGGISDGRAINADYPKVSALGRGFGLNDAQSRSVSVRDLTVGQRRRKRNHWRVRNRQRASTESSTQSGQQSDPKSSSDPSTDRSSEAMHPLIPSTPVTPSGGGMSNGQRPNFTPSGSVRFVAGA